MDEEKEASRGAGLNEGGMGNVLLLFHDTRFAPDCQLSLYLAELRWYNYDVFCQARRMLLLYQAAHYHEPEDVTDDG